MPKARITSKGQVTIPKEVREEMGIHPGDEIEFEKAERRYFLRKVSKGSLFEKYVRYLKKLEGEDPDEIVKSLRGD